MKFWTDGTSLYVDIDPAAITETVSADVPIVGSVISVLEEMLAQVKALNQKVD